MEPIHFLSVDYSRANNTTTVWYRISVEEYGVHFDGESDPILLDADGCPCELDAAPGVLRDLLPLATAQLAKSGA